MFVRSVLPSASSPLSPGQSQSCAHCFESLLDLSRNNREGVIYFTALLSEHLPSTMYTSGEEIPSSCSRWLYGSLAWIQIAPCGALIRTAQAHRNALVQKNIIEAARSST